jgi:hypothetical protein
MLQNDKWQAERLWREGSWGRAYMGVESTGDDIKCEAEWCHQALDKVLSTAAKKIRFCARSE